MPSGQIAEVIARMAKDISDLKTEVNELKVQLDEWTELVHQLQTMKFFLEKPICEHLNDLVKELCK